MEKVTFSEQMIKECENDEQICMVAFGQEEIRDIKDLIGKTIEFTNDELVCVFDDEYGNMYIEVEVDSQRYNVPEKYFKKI
jgi:hypothetical protein